MLRGHLDILDRNLNAIRAHVLLRYEELQWHIAAVQKEGKEAHKKKHEAMVEIVQGVQGYAAAWQDDYDTCKGIHQAQGRAMKEHIAQVVGELIGQIETCPNIGGEITDTLTKHAGELV